MRLKGTISFLMSKAKHTRSVILTNMVFWAVDLRILRVADIKEGINRTNQLHGTQTRLTKFMDLMGSSLLTYLCNKITAWP